MEISIDNAFFNDKDPADEDFITKEYLKKNPFSFCNSEQCRMIMLKEINIALCKLDRNKRDAVLLKFAYDYSIKEIAEKLGVSTSTATNLIYRGKNELLKILKEMGITLK